MIGRTLSHNKITKANGAGSMGEVYRAAGGRVGGFGTAIFLALLSMHLNSVPAFGQRASGEVRLKVKDPSGAPVEASGTLRSLATGVHRPFETDGQGRHEFRSLPFGPYHLEILKTGFSPVRMAIEIRSDVPIEQGVRLRIAPLEAEVAVYEVADTLTDPRSITAARYSGPESIDFRPSSTPGRSVVDLVNSQPGWLLEANGILHPRGSENDVQYVIDGIPLYDNRSPAFAQSLGIDEFESMNVRTAGYSAEFGRKLGGVVEVTTRRDARPGWRGRVNLQGGSFGHMSGFSSVQYSQGRNNFGISGEGMFTDRYLDPPVLENYSNHASGGGFSSRYDRNWSQRDSTRFYLDRRLTGFQVPNELLQEIAGQRQDRRSGETIGHVSHSHVFSPRVLAQMRLMVRDTSARLWSNGLSTPILPGQDRGFREIYASGTLSYSKGSHEVSLGGEALFSSIRENFSYHIISYRLDPGNVQIFDRELPQDFRFKQDRRGHDHSVFAQDFWRRGNFTLSAGIRFDHSRLVANTTAWSPRLGSAYAFPAIGVVLRGAYDRVFQVPAIENVLLASTNLVASLGGGGAFLPLTPSRGNFIEAGLTKSLLGRIRLDATWYRRKVDHFADDSLLLNTGVSFPITFAEAEVQGYEAKVEVPTWGAFSGFVSYSNMVGRGELPVAGGLLLGDEAKKLLDSTGSFPISQDQRNTLRARIRFQPSRRIWFAFGGAYNSGLPFAIEGSANMEFISAQYGAQILNQVDFERDRVRPSASLDASAGLELTRSDRFKSKLQVDIFNLVNRVNLINFHGVLSGTALDRGRSVAIRLNMEF